MILKSILSESEAHYSSVKSKIERKLSQLTGGSIKLRKIRGHKYYYLQERVGGKVVHQYLGKEKPQKLMDQIKKKKMLKAELKKVEEALRMLRRARGRSLTRSL